MKLTKEQKEELKEKYFSQFLLGSRVEFDWLIGEIENLEEETFEPYIEVESKYSAQERQEEKDEQENTMKDWHFASHPYCEKHAIKYCNDCSRLDMWCANKPERQEKEDFCQWENCSGGRYCEKHSLETKPEKEREHKDTYINMSEEIVCRECRKYVDKPERIEELWLNPEGDSGFKFTINELVKAVNKLNNL